MNGDMDYSATADLYDVYVKSDFDIPFFLREADGCGRVLELMSGTGRVSIPLLEAGVPLTCVDRSARMLEVLRRKLEEKGIDSDLRRMDVCDLALDGIYDLICIPFHAFAEIRRPADQRRALRAVLGHLSPGGRFICTLHNPPVRLRRVDGELHHLGTFPLPDGAGTLILSSVEALDDATHLVTGVQLFELYDADGVMQTKRIQEGAFYLHDRAGFRALVESEGFQVRDLFGDYSRSPFRDEESPFMIWVLGR